MKKWLLFVLLALLLETHAFAETWLRGYDPYEGYQYVQLGVFPQDADGTERPILWRVLNVEQGQAYLLSERILFCSRIHPDDRAYAALDAAFCETELFALLNGPFEGSPLPEEERESLLANKRMGYVYLAETSFREQAFTPEEQAMLMEDTERGMVFLPSAEEIKSRKNGLASSAQRKASGTEYALANGLFRYQDGSSPYWTRSQSQTYAHSVRCTKADGDLGYIRCVVMNEGVRPAVLLRVDGLVPAGGDGTMDDPYILIR